MFKRTMKPILVLPSAGPVSTAPPFNDNNNNRGVCSCNGYLNPGYPGQGECRSKYQGKAFCYVDPGRCPDQAASVIEGRWWSHKACQEKQWQCRCNGLKNSRGEGECRSSYKGQAFCYVDRGSCEDETKSTFPNLWWSYQACSTNSN